VRVEYIQVEGSSEHFNVDVYAPDILDNYQQTGPMNCCPGIIIVAGGGGKDMLTGTAPRGKHAAAYHDLAECLAADGSWVFVPSRRGDPQRTPQQRLAISADFQARLPPELFADSGPNDGTYTHLRQVSELRTLITNLPRLCGSGIDTSLLGVIGKSAGGGVALALASEMRGKIVSIALWGSALKTSQWFGGPKADEFFQEILTARQITYDRDEFLGEMCDAIDFIEKIYAPLLLACSMPDPYCGEPPEVDRWATVEDQIELLRYAVNAHYARMSVVKGAEHTMHRGLPAWRNYAATIKNWFRETLYKKSAAL
jgi:pimeloyl-ACP methyl ester carboxylesterase